MPHQPLALGDPALGDPERGIVPAGAGFRVERETGFEPATPSLEGSRSSQLSYSRQYAVAPRGPEQVSEMPLHRTRTDRRPGRAAMVGRGGFEPPKALPTDLQSAPFGRLGISPGHSSRWLRSPHPAARSLELAEAIEPPTR